MKSIPAAHGAATATRASFWCVSPRTMQKWQQRPGTGAHPPASALDDPAAMLRWVASLPGSSQRKLTPSFRRRVDELRLEAERTAGRVVVADPDYAEFERTRNASASSERSILASLKRQADYALFKLERAQARGALAEVKDATETLRHLAGVIHDEEIRADKLGREIGEIIPRKEAERIARAVAYWLIRSVDDLLAELCPRLSAASASGPLHPEEVRQVVEPTLLSARVLTPLERATQITSGTALPRWCVDSMREALAATLENGAAEFDRLHATTPPPPAPLLNDGAGI